jgi:hypothetical protein
MKGTVRILENTEINVLFYEWKGTVPILARSEMTFSELTV